MLQQESENVYGVEASDDFSRSTRLKTEADLRHALSNKSTHLKKAKRELVSYSSERINQISRRLAAPKGTMTQKGVATPKDMIEGSGDNNKSSEKDKENKFRSVMERRATGKMNTRELEKHRLVLPSITTLKTEELRESVAPGVESTAKVVEKWMEKRSKPSKIEELIQKLEVIKRSNQKKSMQKLPFIFIQSMLGTPSER